MELDHDDDHGIRILDEEVRIWRREEAIARNVKRFIVAFLAAFGLLGWLLWAIN